MCVCPPQARNKTGQVGYVPEKYLQFPTSNSLLSMLQSLSALDARSHTSSNSTEPELHAGGINGESHSRGHAPTHTHTHRDPHPHTQGPTPTDTRTHTHRHTDAKTHTERATTGETHT